MIEVFIADERDVVRRGFVQIVSAASGMRVVGEAGTAAEASRRVALTDPRLLIGSPEIIETISPGSRAPSPPMGPLAWVVRLRTQDDPGDGVERAVPISGTEPFGLFMRILRRAAVGHLRPRFAAAGQVVSAVTEDARLAALSRRERDVLSSIALGRTNRQIGEFLGISEKTVKNYASNVFAKLGVQHRTEAIVIKLQAEGRLGSRSLARRSA